MKRPPHSANRSRRRLAVLALAIGLVAAACSGGDDVVAPLDCGRDTQTGARTTWTADASACFRSALEADIPAVAVVVEAREGQVLSTVEYETLGGTDFRWTVIPSGGVPVTRVCSRLSATLIDNAVQLEPRECAEPSG